MLHGIVQFGVLCLCMLQFLSWMNLSSNLAVAYGEYLLKDTGSIRVSMQGIHQITIFQS